MSETLATRARKKLKKDMALNLSELSEVTGWDRGSLSAMNLPLEKGRIIYSDFRRVLHRRQDAHEDRRAQTPTAPTPKEYRADRISAQVAARFYAPRVRGQR